MRLLHHEREILCPEVSTLMWDGDELVDITQGIRIGLDGAVSRAHLFLGYPFDRAVGLRQRDTFWAVAYGNRTTKSVLMKNGAVHRELNRSYYCAEAYDYPVVLAVGPTRRAVVIHCPNSFDTLEVEDAESGVTLGKRKSPGMEFHSRLAVSPNGRYVLDAGWFWHPVGGAWLCDFASLYGDAQAGEFRRDVAFSFGAEIDSAAFLGSDDVVVTSTDEVINEDTPVTAIWPLRVGVWSISRGASSKIAKLPEPSGTIMPWREWIISFYGCPKAIEITTGETVHRWEAIYSGRQIGSIDLGDPPPPPIALDPENGRFAVSGPNGITVVTLDATNVEPDEHHAPAQ